jgi:hypothetical protein
MRLLLQHSVESIGSWHWQRGRILVDVHIPKVVPYYLPDQRVLHTA